jgi:SAM-dependent methyltransferase
MHDTARTIGRMFFETYCSTGPCAILEVGSQNVNGALRDEAPPGCSYTGVDLEAGPGVDIVLERPHELPFDDETFDAIVSSSCFEHDAMFWLSFLEVVRVTKPGGLIYISAPSNGAYHCHPVDNWRFYPDAAVALAQWAGRQGYAVELVESFVARRVADQWNDCVMVFRRGGHNEPVARRIVDRLPDARNIRRGVDAEVERREERTEDMLLLAETRARLAEREGELAQRTAELRAAEARLAAAEPQWVGFDC